MWNAHRLRHVFLSAGVLAYAAVMAATTGCRDEPGLIGQITADGSSTVFPLTTAVTDEFLKAHPGVKISVAISGTSGGFEMFCRGETDIQNASRPIDERERAACDTRGVAFLEVPVAYDALTIIVHPSNVWATSMTVAELKRCGSRQRRAES